MDCQELITKLRESASEKYKANVVKQQVNPTILPVNCGKQGITRPD